TGTDGSRESADDFSADTETFGSYLNAQLNGSAELGVQRIDDPTLRESLEGIKAEYDDVLESASAIILKNS
ncbi:chemotaxis protein, partial [Yersinia pestis]